MDLNIFIKKVRESFSSIDNGNLNEIRFLITKISNILDANLKEMDIKSYSKLVISLNQVIEGYMLKHQINKNIEYEFGRLSGILSVYAMKHKRQQEYERITSQITQCNYIAQNNIVGILRILYRHRNEDEWISHTQLTDYVNVDSQLLNHVMNCLESSLAVEHYENENEKRYHITNEGIRFIENQIKDNNKSKKINSHEYKEKLFKENLLNKINELYFEVKGEYINKEILYSGKFLEMINETIKLPNGKTVKKEKIIKNGGKNSVIVIAKVEDKFIISFQNRIENEKTAEFISGYIENGETPIEGAKRELLEETGYSSDDLLIINNAYTSYGIENSKTYIIIANNCKKINEPQNNGTEYVKFNLFTKKELDYLFYNGYINGAMNQLAYHILCDGLYKEEQEDTKVKDRKK